MSTPSQSPDPYASAFAALSRLRSGTDKPAPRQRSVKAAASARPVAVFDAKGRLLGIVDEDDITRLVEVQP